MRWRWAMLVAGGTDGYGPAFRNLGSGSLDRSFIYRAYRISLITQCRHGIVFSFHITLSTCISPLALLVELTRSVPELVDMAYVSWWR